MVSTAADDRALAGLVAGRLARLGPRPRILLAFSGGVDSTALAHLLTRARRKIGDLRFAHVDHGLQATSADWTRHCARIARAWRVPFVAIKARVEINPGDSPEAAAREARYRALASVLAPGEVLVTAQHREDQVETLLLQLFRGAGVAGLAAMPDIAPFGAGRISRPLLEISRASLVDYATRHGLRWVEDPTNAERRFARNHLRHEILPPIRERWPGVDSAIARSARHLAEAQGILTSTAQRDLARLADGAGIRVAGLRALPPARRVNALREFARWAGAPAPSSVALREMSGPLIEARDDALPEVSWGAWRIKRRAGRLEVEPKPVSRPGHQRETASKSWRWRQDREFIVNDAGDRLCLIDDPHGSIDLDRLPAVLVLRTRVGGEALRPGPRARTQSLKKLMQAARLTLEDRARLPLLFGEGPKGRLFAAGDRWLDASVWANVKSRSRARLVWKRND